jgi:hypothetical protein
MTRAEKYHFKALLRLLHAISDRDAALRQRMAFLRSRGLPDDLVCAIEPLLKSSTAELETIVTCRFHADLNLARHGKLKGINHG